MPQMKVIWNSLNRRVGKGSAKTISKALERAVRDLWLYGDREVMATYRRSWLYDRPGPKEFISVVAARLWDGVERTPEQVG